MLAEGTVVGDFRIIRQLGSGGMATVYEAHQISLNRVAALKVLAQHLGEDPNFRERFTRECHIQGGLDHPNIVPVYGAGESPHGLYLGMRLVRGPSLRELLTSEKLSPDRSLEILAPVAGALDVAHSNDLIHRDVAPQNILIDERGHTYLADFGITKSSGDRSLTRTGQFVGTLDYVTPEQIRDEPTTAATDVYSLSAILFECLAGRVPFDKGSEAAVLYAHVSEDPPRLTEVEPALPEGLDPVLERGLAKQQGDRYATASALIQAARDALREPEPRSAPEPAAVVTAPPEPEPEPEPEPTATKATRRLARTRPVATVPVGDGEPATIERGDDPDRSPSRSAIALLVAMGLLTVAIGVGLLTGGDSEARTPPTEAAGELEVTPPSGWAARSEDRVEIEGMVLTDAVRMAPRDSSGEAGEVVVGTSSATGKSLLPASFERAAGGASAGAPVSLGSLEALRYDELRPPGSSGPLTVFAAPTAAGVATVVCRPEGTPAGFSETCGQTAATLATKAKPFPLGPSPDLARTMRTRVSQLANRRSALRGRLAAAGSAAEQAAIAGRLAKAFRRSARSFTADRVTPQSQAGLDAVVEALRGARDSYGSLADAAGREEAGAYAAAKDEVRRAEGAVDERLVAMRQLGYRVGGDPLGDGGNGVPGS